MTECRWIKMSSTLILLLQLTAITEQRFPSLTARVGDDVTLSCENAMDSQDNCDSATWLFSDSRSKATVVVVNGGQISENAKAKSDRLSVTADCSLVIKKVTRDDVGHYTCRQFDELGQQQGEDAMVYLSVVTMAEHEYTDEVTLHCSVRTYDRCTHTVKWLFQGQDATQDHQIIKTSQSLCSASVTFLTSLHIYTSRYKLFTCAVTDGDRVQVFPFRSQSSGEKPGEDTTTAATTASTTTTENNTTAGADDPSPKPQACTAYWSTLDYIMLAMRVAELLLITVITVLLIRAPRNQRPPDDNTVHHDGTVKYESNGNPSVSARFH